MNRLLCTCAQLVRTGRICNTHTKAVRNTKNWLAGYRQRTPGWSQVYWQTVAHLCRVKLLIQRLGVVIETVCIRVVRHFYDSTSHFSCVLVHWYVK